MDVVALLSLVMVIVMGVLSNKNVGILAFGMAFLLGLVGKLPTGDIIAGFPTSLFFNLFGMFFLFSIAKANGALDLFAKKTFVKMTSLKKIYPFLTFLVSALITLVDPGGLTGYVVLPVVAMGIGYQMGYEPIFIGIITIFGAVSTLMTPVGVYGQIANSLIETNGFPESSIAILVNGIVIFTICGLVVFLLLKGWRTNSNQELLSLGDVNQQNQVLPEFNKSQKLTLLILVLMVLSIMVLKTHAGLTGCFFSAILLLLKAADEKETFKGVPWATIFMIVGISTLLAVIDTLGGTTLLANGLTAVSNRWTAAPLLSFTSSIMSFFSLAMAGPVPTLMKTLEQVNASIGNPFEIQELISAIISGGFTASISPFSLGGAMIMASYDTLFQVDGKTRTKVFNKLFIVAIVISFIVALLSNTGIYKTGLTFMN